LSAKLRKPPKNLLPVSKAVREAKEDGGYGDYAYATGQGVTGLSFLSGHLFDVAGLIGYLRQPTRYSETAKKVVERDAPCDGEFKQAVWIDAPSDQALRDLKDEKEYDRMLEELVFKKALIMAKGLLFKADKPYRCRLGVYSQMATNGSGVLNFVVTTANVVNCTEWSTLDVLFDECFVHSYSIKYLPYNTPLAVPVSSGAVPTVITTTSAVTGVASQGLIMACYFSTAVSTAAADTFFSNPNHKLAHSAKPFRYTWRNNTKFEKRGPSFSPSATTSGWLGWTNVSQAGDLGGCIGIRALHDTAFGSTSNTVTLGSLVQMYDVSFRARF